MEGIQQLKDKNLLEYVQATLWENWKKEIEGYRFRSGKTDKTPSLLVYKDNNKGYFDYSWRLGGGSIIDFQMNFYGMENWPAIKSLCDKFWIVEERKEFKKSPKRIEFLENFENFRMTGVNSWFGRFLKTRGFTFEQIQEEIIWEISKEFGFAENNYLGDEFWNKDFILFPELDEDNQIIWIKFRRTDWEPVPRWKLDSIKEWTVKGSKSGLLFSFLDENSVIICEWPCDYIVLKFLGYKSVICNLGWVNANREILKKLLKSTKEIISFYDNDPAGKKWNKLLAKELNRPIKEISYPEIEGKSKFDVNDLFEMWYLKDDFDKLISNSSVTDSINECDENLIIEKEDGYYVVQAFKDDIKEIKITNFKIAIEDIIEFESNNNTIKILVLKVTNWDKTVFWEFQPKDVADVRGFKTIIKWLETSFSTYDMKPLALEGLLRYIHRGVNVKNTKVVDKKGYVPEFDSWVFDEGIIYNKQFIEFNELNVVDIWERKLKSVLSTRKNIPVYQDQDYFDNNIWEFIINDFRHLFSWKQWDLVLWFLMAGLFVNNLKKILKPFPILFVSGKKWSGKTMAMSHALRVLWLEDSAYSAEEDNIFVDQFNLSEVSSLPVWSDEYKNGKKTKEKNGFYKTVFDRNGSNKWTINKWGIWSKGLRVENYDINWTLVLSGEQAPIDDALFSRVCLINVSNKRSWPNIYEDIVKRSWSYWSILRLILEKNDFQNMARKFEKMFNFLKKKLINDFWLEKRILNVYLPVITWYFFFNTIILSKNLLKDEEFLKEWFEEILQIIKDKMTDEEDEDIVNYFFWIINDLYSDDGTNSLRINDGFIKVTDNNVQIFYSQLFSRFQVKQRQIQGREASSRDLKKYMMNEYWAVVSRMTIWMNWKKEHSLKFDKNNLPENLANIVEYIAQEYSVDINDIPF